VGYNLWPGTVKFWVFGWVLVWGGLGLRRKEGGGFLGDAKKMTEGAKNKKKKGSSDEEKRLKKWGGVLLGEQKRGGGIILDWWGNLVLGVGTKGILLGLV